MPKTKEELKEIKEEYISLAKRLKELDDNELQQVTGGKDLDVPTNETRAFSSVGVSPKIID